MSAGAPDSAGVDLTMLQGTTDGSCFARLRAAFHRLLGSTQNERAAELARIEAQEPAFGAELRALFERFDETDLLAADTPPARLGPFRVQRQIGQGGMGTVWLAERVDGGFLQQVAIKWVRGAALAPDDTRRFLQERQILARLAHPHIAHLIDGGFAGNGRPWLALEYIDGERIDHWCAARNLDLVARVRLLLPVCDAVAFAHRNLVVHRDIKPANILVDGEGRAKLLDFGIARLLDAENAGETRGVLAFTAAYAAPEQREGGAITTATDIYQLGALLRELIRDLPGASSAELLLICAKAMQALPQQRYANVGALADDLGDWLDRKPLRSGIGGRRQRVRRMLWQWRWPLALCAAVLFALALGLLGTLREARIAQAKEHEARANFDALLAVIGSANPGRFAGREPAVGEWLGDAAARLQRDHAHDSLLLHRALAGIGHALMNFGRFGEAVPILQAALAAAQREHSTTPAEELGVLKLLVLAQDEPATRAGLSATAQRIAQLAAMPGGHRGIALDALASAAGSLARVGEHARANELLVLAEQLDPHGASMSLHQRENYWRQAGWVALRTQHLEAARRGFERSRGAQDEDAQAFLPLRRAELDLLLADTALRDLDAVRADRYLAAARPVFEAEYPPGHCEWAKFRVYEAQLAALRSGPDPAAAQAAEAVVLRACSR